MCNDFSASRVGDKCFSVKYGNGEIVVRDIGGLSALFENGARVNYYFDGRYSRHDNYPELYHSDPHIVPPPKPKRMVEKMRVEVKDEK